MATRDATCFAPGFGTGNVQEKIWKNEKTGFGVEIRNAGRDMGHIPVSPSTSNFFQTSAAACLPIISTIAETSLCAISF
jgi:hypothetical protein